MEPGPMQHDGQRVFRRSREDKMIAGVAAGIARYFGIDPVLVRIGFVVLAFSGSGIIAYLLAWLVVPEELTGEDVGPPRAPGRDETFRIVVGIALVAVGTVWLLARVVPELARIGAPVIVIAIGGVLVVRAMRR